ncbi:MAG: TonB-dependent receptor, partial [Longimicrobiales bacterium]|nr:TonB-dependent receptor [Longimicrobiales bacterium]
MWRHTIVAALLALLFGGAPVGAQEGSAPNPTVARDSASIYVLEPLVVEGRFDDLTDIAVTASHGLVGYQDFRLRPLVREGELLETVPGLIMTQHSGDGKSNQMFVRGFNLDHGTDFSTKVEGMQVNVPTHAHGQGYTDVNFIIPELVDHVEYKLGGYYAEIGDFGSAGGAHLRLRRSLPRPLAVAGYGQDGYRRLVAAGSEEAGPGELLLGGELKRYDGPWAIPQRLGKLSGMARYTWQTGQNLFSLLALGYDNDWDASDQIPRRLVQDDLIGRYSQVDSTLGGASSRYSLSGTWMREGGESSQRVDLYGILYELDLYSNFTYFLDDPVNGDQIQQEDDGRTVLGANFAHVQPLGGAGGRHTLTAGLQTRADLLDVALRRTEERALLTTVRADEATQWSTGAFLEVESTWTPELRTVLGLRGDYYTFDVTADLPANSGTADDAIVSPKASVIYSPGDRTEVYLSGGFGFHSNDARGTVQTIDPGTGSAVDPVDPLVPSRGAEVGLRTTIGDGWRSTLAAWTIDLDSELLFVGDAGTTEASGASRRFGVTWTNFYRVTARLAADLDIALTRARFTDEPEGQDRIPGALENVITAGFTWEPENSGPYAALRLRHFGEYALVEDNSVRAPSASLFNLNAGWAFE